MSEDDDAEDPFAGIGDAEDSDAEDPFADLGTDEDSDGEGSDPSFENAADAFDRPEAGSTTDVTGDGEDDPGDEAGSDDPFADVEGVESEEVGLGVRDTDRGGDGPPDDEDPFATLESDDPATDFGPNENDLFTEVEVDDVDDESVWAELAGDEPQEAPDADLEVDLGESPEGEPAVDSDEPLTDEEGETATETIVRKRTYCEQCEYFSEPPEVACGYPGGEIVELVDTERFRVRNCPIVARRESGEVAAVTGSVETDGGEET